MYSLSETLSGPETISPAVMILLDEYNVVSPHLIPVVGHEPEPTEYQ